MAAGTVHRRALLPRSQHEAAAGSRMATRHVVGVTRLPRRLVGAHVAIPTRFGAMVAPPAASDDQAKQPTSSAGDSFPGFEEQHIETLDGLARLLRRNEVLNVCEGLLAGCVLAYSNDFGNAFETSERVLYIVSCLANAFCLRVATSSFEAVEAKQPQGLVTVMAGIQDLNILFSNVAFVAILRGVVQVMEAGIQDPDLVVWLQGLGGAAILLRCVVLQQLLSRKQPTATEPLGLGRAGLPAFLDNFSWPGRDATRSQAGRQPPGSLLIDPAKVQQRLQAFPRVLVSSSGRLRSPQAAWRRVWASVSGRRRSRAAAATVTVDLYSAAGAGLSKPTPKNLPSVAEVARTTVGKSGLVASGISTGLLQSIGMSVEESEDEGEVPQVADEFEIEGVFETVLQNNMEQLQWTALSVLLLSTSTVLLASAHELPELIGNAGGDLAGMKTSVPEALSVSADFVEQIAMVVALSRARTSFRAVLVTKGQDVTHLMEGVSTSRGLGHFLETWGIVQCGVIAALISQLLFAQNWVAMPAKEIIRVAGELVR